MRRKTSGAVSLRQIVPATSANRANSPVKAGETVLVGWQRGLT
jgi:hypothetical protein